MIRLAKQGVHSLGMLGAFIRSANFALTCSMSFSTLSINSNTRLYHLTFSTPQAVFLLSSFTTQFDLTIQDTYGYASATNQIIVSTTKDVFFTNAPNFSSFRLTNPYSFLTLRCLSPSSWYGLHSFALPSSQSVYHISSFSVSSIQTNEASLQTPLIQQFKIDVIRASTLLVYSNALFLQNALIRSNADFAGSVLTSSLSTTQVSIGGNLSSIGSLYIANNLFAQSGRTGLNITLQGSASLSSFSTLSSLQVSRMTNLSTTEIYNGTADVMTSIIATSTLAESLVVSTNTRFNTTTFTFLTTPSFSTGAQISASSLTATHTLSTSTLFVTGVANFFQTMQVNNFISTSGTIESQTQVRTGSVRVSSISSCSGLVVQHTMFAPSTILHDFSTTSLTIFPSSMVMSTLTDIPFIPSIHTINSSKPLNASSLLVTTSTLSFTQDALSNMNLNTLYIQETNAIRSQTMGFNDTIGLLNTFSPKTSSFFFLTNGLYPATSFTGEYMLCANDSTMVLFSSNYGSNFSNVTSPFQSTLLDTQISGSGQYAALVSGTSSFTYTQNFGASWITKTISNVSAIPSTRSLNGIDAFAFSHSGSIQLIAGRTRPTPNQNNLILSTDSGTSWTAVYNYTTANPVRWNSVAMSSNGQIMAALGSNTPIFTNSNTGALGFWTTRLASTLVWTGIAMSYSGEYMTAAASNAHLYTSSNYGSNWTQRATIQPWGKVSMTADGKFQVAAANQLDRFYYSYDYGTTWVPRLVAGVNIVRGVSLSKSPSFLFLIAPGFGPLVTGYTSMQFRSGVDVSGNLNVASTISKSAGAFEIPHPLLSNTKLVHSFIEGPRADLLYRGKVTLDASGYGYINLNQHATANESKMTQGTFEAIARHPQVFLKNNSSSSRVKGSVKGCALTICSSPPTQDTIDWIVVAERNDKGIRSWRRTDKNGYLILEHVFQA